MKCCNLASVIILYYKVWKKLLSCEGWFSLPVRFHQVLGLTTQNIGWENWTQLSCWAEIRIESRIFLSRAWDIWHLLFHFLGTRPYWIGEWYFSLKCAKPQLIPEEWLQPKWVKSESFHSCRKYSCKSSILKTTKFIGNMFKERSHLSWYSWWGLFIWLSSM